jgi:hypothetical protein
LKVYGRLEGERATILRGAYRAYQQTRERAMSKWTVWAGGSEINWQHYTHKIDAERVAEFWREVKGYDDVIVEEVA